MDGPANLKKRFLLDAGPARTRKKRGKYGVKPAGRWTNNLSQKQGGYRDGSKG